MPPGAPPIPIYRPPTPDWSWVALANGGSLHISWKEAWKAYMHWCETGIRPHSGYDPFFDDFDRYGPLNSPIGSPPTWPPSPEAFKSPSPIRGADLMALPSFASLTQGLPPLGPFNSTLPTSINIPSTSPSFSRGKVMPWTPLEDNDNDNDKENQPATLLQIATKNSGHTSLTSPLPSIHPAGPLATPPTSATRRARVSIKKFTAEDLVLLARAVVEKTPFHEPYKRKVKAWKEIKAFLEERGFRAGVSHDVIRQKAIAMIEYHKNPDGVDEKVRAVSAVLRDAPQAIVIAALLDKMEKDWDEVQNADETRRAELKKKNDENRIGGDAIRGASMKAFKGTMKKCMKRRASTEVETDVGESDEDEGRPVHKKSRHSSMETLLEHMQQRDEQFNAHLDAHLAASAACTEKFELLINSLLAKETNAGLSM